MKLIIEYDGVHVVNTENCYYFGIHHTYDNETFKIKALVCLYFDDNVLIIGNVVGKPEQAQQIEDIVNVFINKMMDKIISDSNHESLNLTLELKEMVSND